MRQESMSLRDTAERTVRDIRRKTRKQYSGEEKIRIVEPGLRGPEGSVTVAVSVPSGQAVMARTGEGSESHSHALC